MGRWNEFPDTDRRCCGFDVASAEDIDDADPDVFDAEEEVRCKDEASEETIETRVAISGREKLGRLGRPYRSMPETPDATATNILATKK